MHATDSAQPNASSRFTSHVSRITNHAHHVLRFTFYTLRFTLPTLLTLLTILTFAGCASSSISSRKQERSAAYASLAPDLKNLVDRGQIKVGMTSDAVYIAWGPPSDVVQSESGSGASTVWLYNGGWMEENRYWSHRHLMRDYQPRTYVRAEVIFVNGVVTQWRTLPQPPE
jgi:hypothetical protein